jgi:hypothetical protein
MVTVPRKFAKLNNDDLNKIQSLEKEIGKVILAYEPESPYAELKPEEIDKIRKLEIDLKVIILAYKP